MQKDVFTLSTLKKIKGSRRLVREKILQIIFTLELSQNSSLDDIFNHIFFRIFKFDESYDNSSERILKPDEIAELEADLAIDWSDEDKEFAISLLHGYLEIKERIADYISVFSRNWEMNRIANTDRIIIGLAITELLKFPEIPIKVSINEAIELSKSFSTEKSSNFINGLLDSVKNYLLEQDLIHKEGRGLVE